MQDVARLKAPRLSCVYRHWAPGGCCAVGGLTSLWIHVFKCCSLNRKFRNYRGNKRQMGGLLDDIHCHECLHTYLWLPTLLLQLFAECQPHPPMVNMTHTVMQINRSIKSQESCGKLSTQHGYSHFATLQKGHTRVHLRLILSKKGTD